MGLKTAKTIIKRLMTTIADKHIFPRRGAKKVDIILECHDADRSAIVEDKRYSPILDSIKDDLESQGYTCLSLLMPTSICVNKAYGSPVSAFSLVDEIIWLLLNVVDKISPMRGGVSSRYASYVYERLLACCRPKLIMGIQPSRDLVVACNAQNIPVADVLHGYGIVDAHLVYGLEAMEKMTDNQLCSDYIALDELSKLQIEKSLRSASKKARVWSLLSPVLDPLRPFHNNKQHWEIRDGFEKVCLISLQWGINNFERKYPHDDGEIHPKIHKVLEDSRTQNILFIIKPHPVIKHDVTIMKRLLVRYSGYKNVIIDSDSTLYQLLFIADIHLTIFSTAVREAAFLSVPSLIFSTDDHMFCGENYLFKPELEAGIAKRVGHKPLNDIVSELLTIHFEKQQTANYRLNVMPQNKSISTIIEKIINAK